MGTSKSRLDNNWKHVGIFYDFFRKNIRRIFRFFVGKFHYDWHIFVHISTVQFHETFTDCSLPGKPKSGPQKCSLPRRRRASNTNGYWQNIQVEVVGRAWYSSRSGRSIAMREFLVISKRENLNFWWWFKINTWWTKDQFYETVISRRESLNFWWWFKINRFPWGGEKRLVIRCWQTDECVSVMTREG